MHGKQFDYLTFFNFINGNGAKFKTVDWAWFNIEILGCEVK